MRYFIFIFLLTACSPKPMIYEPAEPIDIQKIPPYYVKEKLDLIPKPTAPKKEYVQKRGSDIALSDLNSSTHVMYSWDEAKKINALKELAISYKALILEQETLVNSYIDQFNSLRSLYALEVERSNIYKSLWIDSENAFKQEEYMHKWDNGINRTGMYVISIGSIVVLLLAL